VGAHRQEQQSGAFYSTTIKKYSFSRLDLRGCVPWRAQQKLTAM
jgi:hypothetical protein